MYNDYISRSATIDALKKHGLISGGYGELVLLRLPAADVAPVVHGRWVDTGLENSTGKIIKCSACARLRNPNEDDVALGRVELYPLYCDVCGARMDRTEKQNV